MKQIIVIKPGTVSVDDQKALREDGVVILFHENPDEVRVISQIDGFEGNELVNAMVGALSAIGASSARGEFASLFLKSLQKS